MTKIVAICSFLLIAILALYLLFGPDTAGPAFKSQSNDTLLNFAQRASSANREVFGLGTQKLPTAPVQADAALRVDYLDVGQADCTVITIAGHTMIIDGGNNENGPEIVGYLKKRGIEEVDYVIATHGHADHIGGLDDILDECSVKNVLMPITRCDTTTFNDFETAVSLSGCEIISPCAGESYSLGPAVWTIVSCDYDAEDINAQSIAIQLSYGSSDFLFMGDTEQEALDRINELYDIRCDYLKVGHHGSFGSVNTHFLRSNHISTAIISCGKDNDYGHPSQSTLDTLNVCGVDTLRTDICGTISIVTDGYTASCKVERNSEAA